MSIRVKRPKVKKKHIDIFYSNFYNWAQLSNYKIFVFLPIDKFIAHFF